MKNLITNSRTRWLGMLISTFILLLGSAHSWACDFYKNVYFNNSGKKWSNVSLVVGDDGYSCAYSFSHLDHTKLYYRWINYSGWNDFYFFNENWGSSNCESNKPWNRVSGKTYWQPYKADYKGGGRVYFDGSTTASKAGDLPLYTATLKVKKSTDGGAYTTISSGSWPATLNLKGTYMDGDDATGQSNFNTSSGDKAKYDDIPVTGEVTMTLGASADSKYEFVGWGTGDSPSDATSPKTYNITGATTYYAFFRTKEYTIAYSGGANAESGSHASDIKYYGTSLTLPDAVFTRAGYAQTGWATSDGGAQAYALGGTYTANSAVTLYPVWTAEVTHDVTVYYKCNGNLIGDESDTESGVGVTTTRNVTAPTIYGYTFSSWTLGSGIVNRTAGSSTTTNPIVINTNATDDYVLTANYTEVLTTSWKLIGDNATNSPFGDNYSYASGKAMSKKSGASATDKAYKTLNLTHTGTWGFKVATASGNSYTYGWGTGDGSYITFNRSKSGSKQDVYTGEQHQLKFNPDGLGEYEFMVDYTSSPCSVTVTFPTVYTVTYGKGTGGNTVSASYSSTSFTSGTKVQSGKTVTFTQLASTGYQFKEWNTNSSGTGTQLSTSATYDHTVASTNNVYAIYNPRQYTITLNDQDATTAVSPATVNATYKSLTLSSAITNPLKTGYTFGGWYSAVGGGGSLIINTSGVLQASKDGYTDATGWTKTSAATVYAKWTQVLDLDKNGGTSDGSLTVTYKKSATSSHTAATRTGYTLAGYYDAESGGNKIINADGTLVSYSGAVSSYISSSGAWIYNGTPTLYAQWTAKSYDVTLKPNGATTGSDQVVRATYDATMPTQTKTSAALVAPTKTGYTLQGFYQNSNGTGTKYYNANMTSANNWDQDGSVNIWAIWQANPYVVTLDVDETNQGNIEGATTSQAVTYDAATTTVSNRPTAAQGYALDGYYTDQLGEGTKVINSDGTWIASVAGYTDGSKNWIHAGDVTLYAYYKKAAITELTLAAAIVGTAETDSITVTPTIDPSPTGATTICWDIQYSNGTSLPSQPAGRTIGNAYRFKAPTASATYQIEAKLRLGDSGCEGTVLSTLTTTFQVAGEHDVTIRYQDSDGRTLKASTVITARPLEWTTLGDITPPTITGYTFARWDAGDGVTIKNGDSDPVTTTTTSSIQIKANYDGTLTAVYNKKNMIFFNNTLGWNDVYVYFYLNSDYWAGDSYGTGACTNQCFGDACGNKPYYYGEHGHMTQIEGTNIWYFDYEAAGLTHWKNDGAFEDVAFANVDQHTTAAKSDDVSWFKNAKVARRGDYKTSLPMFVPLAGQTPVHAGGSGINSDYYNSGYWMNYPENTGYSLLIYNQKAKDGAVKLYEYPFEYTENYDMPMELVVDLEAGQTYGFEIKRADGTYYSNTGKMTANTTNWAMETDKSSYCGLQTTAAGNYTFSFYYSSSKYRMDVTYPVAVNDYRIVYTDLATWSKTAHTASWYHPSRVIMKNGSATEVKKDTVSFFWTYGSSPAIAYQTCSAVAAGSASWSAGTSISVSDFSTVLKEKGIYNFIFEQPAGGASISLVKVEPYTGNFYIRTDCAGSTKWANFQSTDHQMTYSDYAEDNSGYSHYYTHWVTTGQNVKFCIANDYSQCITDTLVEDIGTVIANITAEGNANAGSLNSGNANIRFMWNQATNKISRAYISGSSVISDRFLVLEGDAKMYDENGNALSISGLNANEINLVDDQNFVYERTIKVNTGAKAKLTAKYNTHVQYFKGGSGTASKDSVLLLGGESSAVKHNMRIVYDFKTNRLMTAYVPSDTIKNSMAIDADLMIVREHQEAGQQLLFNGGSLSEVHTVYGVMRFNRWTLNNKEKTGAHSPVGDPKSAYERGLYWISFPFDVNLSDVFGFGTYGTHWIMMEYDGAERAQKGYWKDSEGFWKYVMPSQRATYELKAGKGYVLALDLDLMKDNNSSFWNNNIEQVELFFPSASYVSNIASTNVTTTVASHECTIDRTEPKGGADINKNRTKADSHWNIIGIPSYANYGSSLKDGAEGDVITWHSSPYTNDLPFLYEWSTVDNTYSVQSGTTYPFKSMHAYMVQYHGDLYWSLASATPVVSPIVARRTYAEKPQNIEMRLELSQNEKKVDQTFVKLSNDENVSANFAFDEDLCKEYNANKANIYTFIENYIPAAGNTLPMSEQTMVVPVGVKIATNGDYTFAIPDGTEGIGVTLIDNETGIRTPLSALDYTINLSAGTYDNRFVLEISPIQQMPTGVELLNGENGANGVRKVLIDNILYIVKDGKMFDAQGRQVK